MRLLSAAIGLLLSASSGRLGAAGKPLSVLFIGNSYTYSGRLGDAPIDVPKLLTDLVRTRGERRPLYAESLAPGGWTLQQHWNGHSARERIQGRRWDVVVLQDQSQRPFEDPASLRYYAAQFAAQASSAGATTVLFATWTRQDKPDQQAVIDRVYEEAARAAGARVAPVGRAWKRVSELRPDLGLYLTDKSHPNPLGVYLTACVFYSVLYDRSPRASREALSEDLASVRALARKGKAFPEDFVGAEDLAFLQLAAWEAVSGGGDSLSRGRQRGKAP